MKKIKNKKSKSGKKKKSNEKQIKLNNKVSLFPEQKWQLRDSSERFAKNNNAVKKRTILEGVDAVNWELPIFIHLNETADEIRKDLTVRYLYLFTRLKNPTDIQKILIFTTLNTEIRELIYKIDRAGIFNNTKNYFEDHNEDDNNITIEVSTQESEYLDSFTDQLLEIVDAEFLIQFDEYIDSLSAEEQKQVLPTLAPQYHDQVRNAKRKLQRLELSVPTFTNIDL